MGKNMHGRNGKDLILPVPLGTLVRDDDSGEILSDLTQDEEEFVAVRGGRGGLGNSHFKSATRQAPKFAQPGEEGEERTVVLELKLLADVGLIGLPNAGKSTFISAVSSAKPKIADYPFTTLVPNLGVVKYEDFRSFVIADIPGLIEGAHSGSGLGFRFLRHVERTSILLHLVDVSEMAAGDPVENLTKINRELALFSPDLIDKRQVIAGTKLDIKGNGDRLDMLAKYCNDKQLDFFPVCSVTGEGLKALVRFLAGIVEEQSAAAKNI
jgi:GTP-binding protein